MRNLISAALVFTVSIASGQVRECHCQAHPEMRDYTTNCRATLLSNGSKLYWQFNCQRVWLTLESAGGKKNVLNEVPVALADLTYRLGYQLAKEYQSALLFRSSCPANGPCNFVLINKANGKKLQEFGELLYDHSSRQFYDFVLYFSSPNSLAIHYIDTNKRYIIPVSNKELTKALIPEYEFEHITLDNNMLTLTHRTGKLKLDLRTYHP
jgi:hypothetical protein